MCQSVSFTWSRNGNLAKTGKFFAHLTDMKRSRADVSYKLSEELEVNGETRQSEGVRSLSESLVVTSTFSTVH